MGTGFPAKPWGDSYAVSGNTGAGIRPPIDFREWRSKKLANYCLLLYNKNEIQRVLKVFLPGCRIRLCRVTGDICSGSKR